MCNAVNTPPDACESVVIISVLYPPFRFSEGPEPRHSSLQLPQPNPAYRRNFPLSPSGPIPASATNLELERLSCLRCTTRTHKTFRFLRRPRCQAGAHAVASCGWMQIAHFLCPYFFTRFRQLPKLCPVLQIKSARHYCCGPPRRPSANYRVLALCSMPSPLLY
jgi:hypothetical protein